MKKHINNILIVLAVLLFSAGCTHNDGDIGPLFGTWVLDGMTVDGVDSDLGPDHTFMQFQGGIVMTKLIDDRHSLLFYSVGSWTREGDTLLLNYTHRDDNAEPGEGKYSAPEWLMLKTNSINRVEILSISSKSLHMRHITGEGCVVEYNFRKTH